MDHARRDREIVQPRQPVLGGGEHIQQPVLREDPRIVVDLQRADARGDVDDAGQGQGLQLQHQGMDPEAQLQVQDDGSVFDQQPPIALAAIEDTRPLAFGLDDADDRLSGRAGDRTACRPSNGDQGVDQGVLVQFGLAGAGLVDGLEAHAVSRRDLADLPEVRLDHHERADEAAERGAVGAKDDRHVAGEVDGPDGVGVVVDV